MRLLPFKKKTTCQYSRSVVATQGLGAAVVAQIGGTPQFNQWFLYVLLVFVVVTLLVEIVYLNVCRRPHPPAPCRNYRG